METLVQFKTKVKKMHQADDTVREYVEYKRKLVRTDCNLRPQDHAYFNCDMFPSMLNRAYEDVTNRREWVYLDSLPDGVTVDTSKFLAVVTVKLPENFR